MNKKLRGDPRERKEEKEREICPQGHRSCQSLLLWQKAQDNTQNRVMPQRHKILLSSKPGSTNVLGSDQFWLFFCGGQKHLVEEGRWWAYLFSVNLKQDFFTAALALLTFWSQIILVVGALLCIVGYFSISDFYLLDASSIPRVVMTKNVSRHSPRGPKIPFSSEPLP